ncbi:uncharacterized protein BDR25DRAFT_350825 [Lindgomyces ingoldianus]|uniref:Uncharacterized protein n=1 Tax=Lindgomyces ingoldianus TaxID=673940 RepID=A0ACB6R8H2_9PLEO|nr:uncharacterized protein BDR25DRAFT_350825 [Lindgomyces ingoldianus]KAF2475451.1 hypothetical protein BDR25DRAFT_350825 [Lindgomyces ingoldianus]
MALSLQSARNQIAAIGADSCVMLSSALLENSPGTCYTPYLRTPSKFVESRTKYVYDKNFCADSYGILGRRDKIHNLLSDVHMLWFAILFYGMPMIKDPWPFLEIGTNTGHLHAMAFFFVFFIDANKAEVETTHGSFQIENVLRVIAGSWRSELKQRVSQGTVKMGAHDCRSHRVLETEIKTQQSMSMKNDDIDNLRGAGCIRRFYRLKTSRTTECVAPGWNKAVWKKLYGSLRSRVNVEAHMVVSKILGLE